MQYLIDASVYVFRAYYSMPDDMVDDEGNPINALYGFCRFVGDFMEQVTPEYVAVLFDEPAWALDFTNINGVRRLIIYDSRCVSDVNIASDAPGKTPYGSLRYVQAIDVIGSR